MEKKRKWWRDTSFHWSFLCVRAVQFAPINEFEAINQLTNDNFRPVYFWSNNFKSKINYSNKIRKKKNVIYTRNTYSIQLNMFLWENRMRAQTDHNISHEYTYSLFSISDPETSPSVAAQESRTNSCRICS